MRTTDAQVRKLMEEIAKHGKVGLASMKAGMDRKTGSKYARLGKLPSKTRKERQWRTRADPFKDDWPDVEARLQDASELQAKALYEDLMEQKPDRFSPGQLRTFQRRVRRWRALSGPPKEVFFPQEHRPGEAMQTDFWVANELGITIAGEPFPHMLCHPVLPYSNWEHATVCFSESMAAIKHGVQEAVFRLGRVTEFHQTDNSTAATHDLRNGKRGFNEDYKAFMDHLGMKPRTIVVGESQQNGDVEALHNALRNRLVQHLLLRGSRDFDSVAEYEQWLQGVIAKANAMRMQKVREELAVMRPLQVSRLPEYDEVDVGVTIWSTIRVKYNTYSVPSRLVGERVRVRVYDERLEVYYGGVHQDTVERLRGRHHHRIDYRHVIWSLVKKPHAFARYRYKEDLFPTATFRRAYESLTGALSERLADIEYLRILHLAASTMESEVEAAITLLMDEGIVVREELVKALVAPGRPEVPQLPVPVVDLGEYDTLLSCRGVTS